MEIKKVINPKNNILFERSSIRKYDTTVKISREEMSNILQDAMTAPSSLNLQPWRFVVFDTDEGKEMIKPYMMFNQIQWETSSAVIAIFADLESESTADEICATAVKNGLMTEEYKEKFLNVVHTYMAAYSGERLSNSVMLDCGFVIMQLMLSAKNYGYDTNPIGGFMRKELTEALEMDTKRYLPVLLLTIGKADEDIKPTIRLSVSDVTQWR